MKQLVVFGSGTGTNLEALLRHQKSHSTPSYQVKAIFVDRKCRMIEIGKREGIPVIYHSYVRFFRKNPDAPREAYDAEVVRFLEPHAPVDLIVLAGYMRLVKAPLLEAFSNQIITVHPADLTEERKYTGHDAVYQALSDGNTRTRSTVIQVDEGEDTGPIMVQGPWVEYTEGYPVTQERAERHQQKQKCESDWPALIEAVEILTHNGRRCVSCVE